MGYGKGVLFNDEDHPNAKAAAAILRSIHKNDCPLKLKASVEGGIVTRGILDPTLLKQTKVKRIGLTFVPANAATLIEPVSLDKSANSEAQDAMLIKSVMHLAQEHVPSFREIQKAASGVMIASNIRKLTYGLKALKEENLEKKIEKNISDIRQVIQKIDSESEELDKGIKSTLAAGALGVALGVGVPSALTSKHVPTSARDYTHQVSSKIADATKPEAPKVAMVPPSGKALNPHQKHLKEVAAKEPLLGAIAQVESGGGRNFNHAMLATGMHRGHRAGGMWGMMPRTAAEQLKLNPGLAKKYPDLVKAAKDIDTNHATFTDRFNSDPHAASDFAVSLYEHNKKNTDNDEQLAYSWYHGLKGTLNRLKKDGHDAIAGHPYVQKVMSKIDLNKALSAGYGGASAPSSRTGGAALQAESVSTGMKYLTCPACTKEQVAFHDQVRCRKCNKAFDMTTLSKLFKK